MPLAVFLGDRFLSSPEEASVSLFDRGYMLGDAIFETLRAEDGRVFRLDRHLSRLEEGARALEIAMPAHDLASIVDEAVRRAAAPRAYVRITLSRGMGAGGVAITGAEKPTLSVIAREATPAPDKVASGIAATRRVPPACLPPALKTGNYLPNVLARRELARRGLGEGVMLSVDGAVVSGTTSNVFVVKGDRIATPRLESGCRPGVVREALLELDLGIEEAALDVAALHAADEIFFTSTQVGVLAATSFEGRPLHVERSRVVRDALERLFRS